MSVESEGPSSAMPARVLLAEDDPLLRMVAAESLREHGYVVIEVATGEEAQRYLLAGGEADLVFSDIEMPGRINGLQLCEWVAANHPAMGRLITSGNRDLSIAALGNFISKPYSMADVAATIRGLIEKPGNAQWQITAPF